jgi:hypothetical protein
MSRSVGLSDDVRELALAEQRFDLRKVALHCALPRLAVADDDELPVLRAHSPSTPGFMMLFGSTARLIARSAPCHPPSS